MKIKFYIPEKVSSNVVYSGVHWTKRNKLKNLYRAVKFTAQQVESYPVNMKYTFYFKRKIDTSNCLIMVKLIEDCLVHNKILQDDSYKFVNQITVDQAKGDDYCIIEVF